MTDHKDSYNGPGRSDVGRCHRCHEDVYFNDNYVSQSTGYRIPMDRYSGTAYNCVRCVYYNQRLIFSNHFKREVTGHRYPMDPDTEKRHNCNERLEWFKQGNLPLILSKFR